MLERLRELTLSVHSFHFMSDSTLSTFDVWQAGRLRNIFSRMITDLQQFSF